jgi:S1-C subfamily serine protease
MLSVLELKGRVRTTSTRLRISNSVPTKENPPIMSRSLVFLFITLASFAGIAQEKAPPELRPQGEVKIDIASGNQEILDLLKSGMSSAVIVAKVKTTQSKFDTSPIALSDLKAAGANDEIILAILEVSVPKKEDSKAGAPKRRVTDELTTRFKELQASVVTVWSEFGHGTGFIFDDRGLVMTNQHVIGPSEIISVQFDPKLRVPARVLAVDPQKDVAVLWVDLASLPGATAAKIARESAAEPVVMEGERVMTIGSPLNQRKIMTTGIASKVEARAIISDININHGNSGGPLFNSIGEVIGITTFGDPDESGPGISGIVSIEETTPVVDLAVAKMAVVEKPEARLLPVDPTDNYPLEAIKEIVVAKKFDFKPYSFSEADFGITLITPLMRYRAATEAQREAEKTKSKRSKSGSAQSSLSPNNEFYNWAEYVGAYKPVLIINAQPALGESFWGRVGRGVAANYGIHAQANLRFKTDFHRMKLFCGDTEVAPIHPAKIYRLTNENNYFVRSNDATYAGNYVYPADAINESCGVVRLELFSEKRPEKAETKVLDRKTTQRIIADFQPYFRKQE